VFVKLFSEEMAKVRFDKVADLKLSPFLLFPVVPGANTSQRH
jgi:hypothetical protein